MLKTLKKNLTLVAIGAISFSVITGVSAHALSNTADSAVFTTASTTKAVKITIPSGTFAATVTQSGLTFGGTDATPLAAGTIVRSSDTVIYITGLTGLTGGADNTVKILAAAQATQAGTPSGIAYGFTTTATLTSDNSPGGTSTARTVTVASGTALTITVSEAITGLANTGDSVTVTPTITTPNYSAVTTSSITTTATGVTNKWTAGTPSSGAVSFTAGGSSSGQSGTATVAYAFTPDVSGTYNLSVSTTTTSVASDGSVTNATITDVITVTAVSGSVSSTAISKYASASNTSVVWNPISWTNGSTAITGTGTSFDSTYVGESIWTNNAGFIGTIASVTDATHAVLSSATTATTGNSGKFWVGNLAASTTASGIIANTISGMSVAAGSSAGISISAVSGTVDSKVTARMIIGGQTISGTQGGAVNSDAGIFLPFTAPVAAGTYTATVQTSNGGTYSGTGADTSTITFTLTVSAAHDLSTALSTAYADLNSGSTYSSTTSAVSYSALKTSGTAILGVKVTLLKDDGSADTQGETVTATVSGLGFVNADTTSGSAINGNTRVATNASAASVRYIHVFADGTAGTGSVTVSVTNANTLVTTTLGTWSYTTYGSATKLTLVTTNYSIGKAGGAQTGGSLAARTKTGEALSPVDHTSANGNGNTGVTTPAFVVKATDTNGNPVSLTNSAGTAIVPTIVSSDLTAVSGGTCVLDSGAATYGSSTNGVGFYNCSFTTSANSVSGGKATLTIRTPDPADSTGATYLTATVPVTVGGKVATETLTSDATSYSPGQAMLLTLTGKDSAGNPVYDGAADAASVSIVTSKALGGTAPASAFTGWYVGGTDATAASVAKSATFAPAVTGSLTITATGADAASTAHTLSLTVDDANASAATDQASLATDAANAATDAANAAADSADAATQAATDALNAVQALDAKVSSLFTSLNAKIASIMKLVAAMMKK